MPSATAPLAAKSCTPCRGGVPPLTADEVERIEALDRGHRTGPDPDTFNG